MLFSKITLLSIPVKVIIDMPASDSYQPFFENLQSNFAKLTTKIKEMAGKKEEPVFLIFTEDKNYQPKNFQNKQVIIINPENFSKQAEALKQNEQYQTVVFFYKRVNGFPEIYIDGESDKKPVAINDDEFKEKINKLSNLFERVIEVSVEDISNKTGLNSEL